jgi:predicted transcriptional regulator
MKHREKLKHYFETYPNQPIGIATLMALGGQAAWRTRVSELRTHEGMNIRNQVRSIRTEDGIIRVSEYKYIPDHQVRPTARAKRPARFHGHKKLNSTTKLTQPNLF